MKKLFRFFIKFIIVLLVIAIVATALIFVFVGKDNVMAALKGLTTSTEDIEKNIQETEKQQQDILKDHGFNLSEDDMKNIASGELVDEQEIVDKLLGRENSKDSQDEAIDGNAQTDKEHDNVQLPEQQTKPSEEDKEPASDNKPADSKNENKPAPAEPVVTQQQTNKDSQQTQTPADSTSVAEDKQKAVDEQVAALVAKMYVYKSQYTGSISSLVSAMSSEYYSLPAEQQTYSSKVSIYNRYASQIATMEAQCDAQVNTLVNELKSLLSHNGRDTSLADSLLSAYAAEKENTKAYYVSRYAD